MTQLIVIKPDTTAQPVHCGDGSTVTNKGPQTVYYRDETPVDASNNDGSLASGASVTLTGIQYFFLSSGSATVVATPSTAAATGDVASFTGTSANRTNALAAAYPGGWYVTTDENGGTLYRSNGTTWTQASPGVLEASGRELSSGAVTTTPQTVTGITATDVTGVTTTFNVGSRPIHIEWGGLMAVATSTATLPAHATVSLLEDGVTVDFMQVSGVIASTSPRFCAYKICRRNPSAGSHTYKCQAFTAHAASSITVPAVSSAGSSFGIQAVTEH